MSTSVPEVPVWRRRLAWMVLYCLDLDIDKETYHNLVAINEHLPDGGVVLYSTHTSAWDVPVGLALIKGFLPNCRRVTGPIGISHTRSLGERVGWRLAKQLGVEPLPVVRQKEMAEYGGQRDRLINSLKQATKEVLGKKTGTIYGIAPLGTRGQGRLSQPTRPGLGKLAGFEFELPVMFAPLVILYPHKFYPDRLDLARLAVGRMVSQEEIWERVETSPGGEDAAWAATTQLMWGLAELMPKELRGPYGNE